MEPDHHFDLLKSIMIPRNEDMKKYENKDLKIKLYYLLEIDMKILLYLSFIFKIKEVTFYIFNQTYILKILNHLKVKLLL